MEEYVPMTPDKVVAMMKNQLRLRRIHKKISKANLMSVALKEYDKRCQLNIDGLRKDYNEIKDL